jgi:HD-GYP domain-containing protein (c-di-GMP phosphodiesterase class II)
MPILKEPLYSSKKRSTAVAMTALLVSPLGTFALLRVSPQLDALFVATTFHLLVVSAIAACAATVALFAALAAAKARDASLVFLALGCLAVGAAMLGHGLTTPGVAGMPMNLWVARLPQIAIASFAACLVTALSGPSFGPARFVTRHPWFSTLAPAGLMAAGVVAIVVAPTTGYGTRLLPGEEAVTNVIAVAAGIALVVTGAVHWRRWRLGGDRVQLALTLAAWMSAQAEVSLHFGRLWQVSWWDYHALLLVGFGGAVYAIVVRSARVEEHHTDLGVVYRKDVLSHIEGGYPETLRALVAATEARDAYTRGHSRRVTQLSVRLGQRLGLGTDALRRLAWGAELHDIGKIGVPDYILNKEGPLTPEERALIQQHPAIGWEIARQARSLNDLLDVIRWHHERIDGRGYPDGLAEDEIPLAARIVAIADVWDALTSSRSYRPAFEFERALKIMREGRGTQFDGTCLDKFLALVGRTPTPVP